LLGSVSDTGVKVWARASRAGNLQVEVKASGQAWPGRTVGATRLEADADFTGVVVVDGLLPDTAYEYRSVVDGQPVDGGAFRTLPAAGQPGAFRFVLGGDLDERFAPFTILDRVLEARAAFGILLGDLVYADQPAAPPATVEAYRAKYRANWADPSFRRLTGHTPFFAIWDDHEIVNDYDGADAERYQAARTALQEYIGHANPAPRRSGALYYSFQVADVEFFVLDTRSHRHRNGSAEDSGKSMLGPEQKAELKSWLASSRAPFKIVLSSVPFHDLVPGRPDDWNAFAAERTELLEYIRDRGIPGVVILSGDQHWSSAVQLAPYGVWELNATPLAQYVRAQASIDDPRLALAYLDSTAFGVVDVDTRDREPRLTFSVVDGSGRVRGTQAIRAGSPGDEAASGAGQSPAPTP
jgi:alkaline phosphatase D